MDPMRQITQIDESPRTAKAPGDNEVAAIFDYFLKAMPTIGTGSLCRPTSFIGTMTLA
jgi:hypothetical protein